MVPWIVVMVLTLENYGALESCNYFDIGELWCLGLVVIVYIGEHCIGWWL